MYDSIYIGATSPFGESCVNIGCDDYATLAKAEGNLFIEQIVNHYGEEPGSGHFVLEKNMHDFGMYLSVEYRYRDDDEEAMEYGFNVEGDVPNVLECWDKDKKSAANNIIKGATQ